MVKLSHIWGVASFRDKFPGLPRLPAGISTNAIGRGRVFWYAQGLPSQHLLSATTLRAAELEQTTWLIYSSPPSIMLVGKLRPENEHLRPASTGWLPWIFNRFFLPSLSPSRLLSFSLPDFVPFSFLFPFTCHSFTMLYLRKSYYMPMLMHC